MSSRFSALLLSGAAFVAAASPSFAIEPKQAADALLAVLAVGSATDSAYDEAVAEGGDVVIRGLRFSRGSAQSEPPAGDAENEPSSDGASPEVQAPEEQDSDAAGASGAAPSEKAGADGDRTTVTFAETRIENPQDGDASVFDSARITFNDGNIEGDPSGTITRATLVDVKVLDPKTVQGNDPGKGLLFRTAEVNDLSFKPATQPAPITVARMFVEMGDVLDNVPQSSKGSIDTITIPPEAFAQNAVGPKTIGYDSLVLGLSWDGSRDVAADTMDLRDFTVRMQDGGAFSMSAKIGKLPPPNTMNDADASSKMAQVEVHTLTLQYDDQSLAGRVLDYLAQQQGIERQAYADQIAAALPFMMAALNNPEFQSEVTTAVGAFLKDPKSLTIKLEPSAPVSASEIMSIAGSAPGTLPDRLNASISANAQ